MRCKKHPADQSSSVGVCASCLRERLMAAQSQAQAQQDCRKSHSVQQQQPTWQLHQRQHSTPLVGPTGLAQLETRQGEVKGSRGGGGRRLSSLFLGLFRSKSKTGPGSGPGVPASPSWLSAVVPGRRRKQDRAFWPSGARRKSGRDRDRGMSPAKYDDDDEHCRGGRSSGYSSESSQGWRQTPARRGAGHGGDVSGFGFCLSPLVRPSPHRRSGLPPEKVAAGEYRVPATSFCKNRSRKLADFGRYSYNTNHCGDR